MIDYFLNEFHQVIGMRSRKKQVIKFTESESPLFFSSIIRKKQNKRNTKKTRKFLFEIIFDGKFLLLKSLELWTYEQKQKILYVFFVFVYLFYYQATKSIQYFYLLAWRWFENENNDDEKQQF